MNVKKLSIIGENGEVKEILAFSERVRIFYERFPRERFSVIVETIPQSATSPFLQSLNALKDAPEALKEVVKKCPSNVFQNSVHYRCSLRDDLTQRVVGSADAFGEIVAYKDLERIQSAAFSRMLAIVCDINADDLDGDIESDIQKMGEVGTQIKSATAPSPHTQPAKKEGPSTVAAFPRRSKEEAFEDSADKTESPSKGDPANTAQSSSQENLGLFFLLEDDDAKVACEIATEFSIDASLFANYLGSDKVRLRRIIKQYHRVTAGALSKEDFVALINEKIGE